MSDRRGISGRDQEPDPYRKTVVVLGIILAVVAFGVIGYAFWTGDATTNANAPDENADDRVEELNDSEPPEAPSNGGEEGGNTTKGPATETDANATQGSSGETNESSNQSASPGSNPEPEPPSNETAANQTNQQNQSNQTNQQNQANQTNQPNQTTANQTN